MSKAKSEQEYRERVERTPLHNVIMENRRMLTLSGVLDVAAFDENVVTLLTELGELTVGGCGLHIGRFDQETGEMTIDGEISELIYTETEPEKKGFFSRLFS